MKKSYFDHHWENAQGLDFINLYLEGIVGWNKEETQSLEVNELTLNPYELPNIEITQIKPVKGSYHRYKFSPLYLKN